MLDQAITSLLVGGAISVVLFIPVLIWQYRRYGAFQPARTIWTVVTFVYVTALITYTLFPLPDMSGDYCATHPQVYVLDPTLYFREMAERLAGASPTEVMLSWEMLQMVFNVALFVPLGAILSDFVVLRARWGVPVGLGVSLLVEATQFTGNWGLMACPYRVADVNDLITNTLGTAVGYLVALLIPRFVARPGYLRMRRLQARPVTVWRRWTGMLLDAGYWAISWWVVNAAAGMVLFFVTGRPLVDETGSPEAATLVVWYAVAALSLLVMVLLPALIGNGASLGQRTVWLTPLANARWRLLARALAVQGLAVIAFLLPLPVAGVVLVWVVAAVISVLFARRGLSCVVTGCRMVDVRADPAEALATADGGLVAAVAGSFDGSDSVADSGT